MVLISEQVNRIKNLLLDSDDDNAAWDRSQIRQQHQFELDRLGREGRFGSILQMQGIEGQALYTLPDSTAAIVQVLYNGLRLDFTSEVYMDHRDSLWAFDRPGEPTRWTSDNQSPNVIRLIPPPSRTGSVLPQIPPRPFSQSYVDNLIVFYYGSLSEEATDEVDGLPLLDVWSDPLVWRVAAEMSARETPFQSLPLSQSAFAISELWLSLLES